LPEPVHPEFESSNFRFLREHDPLLLRLCAAAESYSSTDPNTALLKLRQFGEAVARNIAASFGIDAPAEGSQAELLGLLQRRGHLDRDVAALLHALRKEGNDAAHRFETTPGQAREALKLGRTAAIWFHRAFGANVENFKPGPFVDPVRQVLVPQPAPAKVLQTGTLEPSETLLADERARREASERRAELLAEERSVWEQLAQDEERQRLELQAAFEAHLAALRTQTLAHTPEQAQTVANAVAVATAGLDIDESETRALIDDQLRAAGWEADTKQLRYAQGARPETGRNLAIAEWPTDSGPADYVLFVGLTPVGVVEAKKFGTDIAQVLPQAERYSLGFRGEGQASLGPSGAGQASLGWAAGHATITGATHYRVPFVFAANGRPYHRQFLAKSGVWFRDARLPQNHGKALDGWYTPEGLQRLLQMDQAAAEQELAAEPFGYLNLRDYQVRAVQAVEQGIAQGRRECLVAMATGTGKTRTVIGLLYRLLKARRFHRILFLVDRKDLGTQAQDAFKGFRLEQDRLFTEVFELKELEDVTPDSQTRVHVATVQGMARRLFSEDGQQLPIDRYDCIVVDEAHRGYTLDREMGEGEIEFRSEADYISAYRRVLDHFDAVKVALTATPAQHTVQIFGLPIYTYTYREAVIDGWLIDHEPPVRLVTRLAQKGIHFERGTQVDVFTPGGHLQQQVLPDELEFEVDAFNRLVITENFNRVVCEALAEAIDPLSPAKTLIFCANDAHADLVVTLLRQAMEAVHGPINDKAVVKITGKADKPSQLIRLFKNEQMPNIAVTVDLLTTGIDVPAICNLVFLRRVRSRILYEQMLGRATRPCPGIGKDAFRIFDAVDLYQALDAVNTMKPVVTAPTVPLPQLVAELTDPKAHQLVTGSNSDGVLTHADDVAAQLLVRVRNLIRRAQRHSGRLPQAADALQRLQLLTGEEPGQFTDGLRLLDAAQLRDRFSAVPTLAGALQALQLPAVGNNQVISTHEDELIDLAPGFGQWARPEDYLDAFSRFVNDNRNKIAALDIVLTRPRELTREHLRELLVALAQNDFTERSVSAAWKQARNEDIAATLIGYIRQLALGSPLVPFETRVDRAMVRLLASRAWTEPQKRWLQRIATAVKSSWVVDASTFTQGAWAAQGGLRTLDTVFDGQALQVVQDLEDAVWSDAA
jgi:type I restriction enzyme R subunit